MKRIIIRGIGVLLVIASSYFWGWSMDFLMDGGAIDKFWVLPTIILVWLGSLLYGLKVTVERRFW